MNTKRITLMGSELSKSGSEFIYYGKVDICEDCRFNKVCHDGLIPNKRYKIVGVRSTNHPCKLFKNGVKVVEIVPSEEMVIGIESKKALEGMTITHSDIRCNNIFCENYNLCHPEGIGKKYQILEIKDEKINCLEGHSIKLVVVRNVE